MGRVSPTTMVSNGCTAARNSWAGPTSGGIEPGRHRVELGRRLTGRGTVAEPRHDVELAGDRVTKRLVRGHRSHGRHGSPGLDTARILEPRRHDADDGERLLADGETPPEDVVRTAIASPPEAVTQHQDLRRAGDVVRRVERASYPGVRAQHLEERTGDVRDQDGAGLPGLDERDLTDAVLVDAGHGGEGGRVRAKRVDLGGLERDVRTAVPRGSRHTTTMFC